MTFLANACRVIMVEDDKDLRESIAEYLTLSGLSVTGVGNCLDCYACLKKEAFNVAVIDLSLPDQSGFVLAEYLRANTALPIIILTAKDALEDRILGYSSGADLYLIKPVDTRELLAAISSLAGRRREVAAENALGTADSSWKLYSGAWTLSTPDGTSMKLTSREFRFLELLMKSPGRTVLRFEIISLLGYSDDEFANRAMDSLVRRLRRKIEEKTRNPSPVRTVHASGYCFTSPATICS